MFGAFSQNDRNGAPRLRSPASITTRQSGEVAALSASTAATLGLAGLLFDTLIALMVVFRHPEFIKTGEFLAFALLLVFCNLVHSWLAISRTPNQNTKIFGFILAGLSLAGFLALII